MVRLSTQRKQDNATRPPVTTARQKSPPASNWLPVLEKHDIPVVVGVSVSLALIFISMGVYSFCQKIEHAKGNSTSSQKSSNSRRRRNYLEADEAYENRAFEVECSVDAVEQNPYDTNTSPSLLHSDPTLPAAAAGHREEPLSVAAGEALQTAQARAVDSPVSLQRESAHQEKHPSPHKAAPSSVPAQLKSAGPGEPGARAPGMCSATSPALQHIGTTLYFHGPEPLLRSIVPLGGNTSGNHGQVTAAPVVGMVEHSPPGDQSSSGIAMMSVTVEIHLYPCSPEMSSAPAATQNVSDSSHPEAAGAASQQPASLVGPGM
ncbi:ras-related protein M-Ras [Platysternon megacephalum]|uniref:Ras-related protein M-Ras n=1 Tax=Platysternon megacephalum TaxID=55544 RepID=A0A4D9EK48_9SAUR|nr:ras-related protein M-Ras [Platysternon megacephalum]